MTPAAGPLARIRSVELIVGLEVHVELATRTKMFSRALNPAHPEVVADRPNSLVDPTVLALPGALPVINREAVEMAMLVGLALHCRIAERTKWDRKSYFYPDLPKAYQISQYDLPLCFDGYVDVPATDEQGFVVPDGPRHRVGIIRAHLEEDAGKLLHEAPGGAPIEGSIVDLNRAGAPLLEIVTQPDLRTADQAVAFARQLRQMCRFLGVTQGIMQQGHMRFEPNINTVLTLDDGRRVTTPIVEIKNLNSFRSLRAAIEYELAEQPRRWAESGIEMAPGRKSTRGWDDVRLVTVLQREKEEAQDYRYFPDPDLLPVEVTAAWREAVRSRLPELPTDRLVRYVRDHGLGVKEATALVEERADCEFFEACTDELARAGVARGRAGKLVANVLLQTGARLANERGVGISALGITPGQVARVILLREAGQLSSNAADQLVELLCAPGQGQADPEQVARDGGLLTVRDETALARWCDEVLAANAGIVAQIQAGKTAAVGRLIGEVMKLSGGQADPQAVRQQLLDRLGVS